MKLSWKVYYENFNAHKIAEYDIFKPDLLGRSYFTDLAKELKRQYPDRKDWEEAFDRQLKYRFSSKSEYEVIITSWPPHITADEAQRLQEELREYHMRWGHFPYKVSPELDIAEKIDIYSQLMLNRDVFFDYVWRNI